jgi:hypothetical protein
VYSSAVNDLCKHDAIFACCFFGARAADPDAEDFCDAVFVFASGMEMLIDLRVDEALSCRELYGLRKG